MFISEAELSICLLCVYWCRWSPMGWLHDCIRYENGTKVCETQQTAETIAI